MSERAQEMESENEHDDDSHARCTPDGAGLTLKVSIVTTHQEVRDGENSSTSPVVMGRTLLNDHEEARDDSLTLSAFPFSTGLASSTTESFQLEQDRHDDLEQTETRQTAQSRDNDGHTSTALSEKEADLPATVVDKKVHRQSVGYGMSGCLGQEDQAGVTVEFHVLVHPSWNFSPRNGDTVHIRFGAESLGDWQWNCVDMKPTRVVAFGSSIYTRLVGSLVLPPDLSRKEIPYMYVMIQSETRIEEEGAALPADLSEGKVHRCLSIPDELRERSRAVFHKYDDVIMQHAGWLRHAVTAFTRSEGLYVENRLRALEAMLPQWNGFCSSDQDGEEMTGEEALAKINHVVQSLMALRLQDSKSSFSWTPQGFDHNVIRKVLYRHVSPRLKSLARAKAPSENWSNNVLQYAVVIAVLTEKYNLQLKREDLVGVLQALALNPNEETRTCPDYDALCTQYKNRSMLGKGVEYVSLLGCMAATATPHWLLALPLLHFLRGESSPFQLVNRFEVDGPRFWGLSRLDRRVREFQSKHSGGNAASLSWCLSRLFRADQLTARAFLFLLKIEQLVGAQHLCHPVTVMRSLVEKLQSETDVCRSKVRDSLGQLIPTLVKRCSGTNVDEDIGSVRHYVAACVELLSLVSQSFHKAEHIDLLQNTKKLVFVCLSRAEGVYQEARVRETAGGCDQSHNSEERRNELFFARQLEISFEVICDWLGKRKRSKAIGKGPLLDEMKLWALLIRSDGANDSVTTQWEAFVAEKLEARLQRVDKFLLVETCILFVCVEPHPVIRRCLDTLCDNAVAAVVTEGDVQLQTKLVSFLVSRVEDCSVQTTLQRHAASLMTVFVTSSCPRDGKRASSAIWLGHLLSWPFWSLLLRQSGRSRLGGLLPGPGDELVAHADSVLTSLISKLGDGTVTIADMSVVKESSQRLVELCKERERTSKTLDKLQKSLELRLEELDAFSCEKAFVGHLLSMCSHLEKVDIRQLSACWKADVDQLPIRSLCSRPIFHRAKLSVTYFKVPLALRPHLEPLWLVRDSRVFKSIWIRRGEEVSLERHSRTPPCFQALTLDDVAQIVCPRVFSQWTYVCWGLKTGSIRLKDVSSCFRWLMSDRSALEQQLNWINLNVLKDDRNNKWVKERTSQIMEYGLLKKCVDTAKKLKAVVEVLHATSCLPDVNNLCQLDSAKFQNQPLTILTPELQAAGHFLVTVTDDQAQCLQTFADQENLIRWLRVDIGDLAELKTFVELASAEDDLTVMKVSGLRASCATFATFLFEVNEQTSLADLETICASVFQAFKTDPQLLTKWTHSGRYVEEFKLMRSSLASVKESSFSHLTAIIKRGHFAVGNICKKVDHHRMEMCVNVEVGTTCSGSSRKIYWLDDLRDLQSKLMLISGDGDLPHDDEVRIFVSVLEKAVRLADCFLSLSHAGHVAYLDWNAEFVSSSYSRPADSGDVLDVRDDCEGGRSMLFQELDQLAEDMARDLRDWLEHVEMVRSEFYYVNCFTTPQLLMLREQLAKLAKNRSYQLPNHVSAMLKTITPDCSFRVPSELTTMLTAEDQQRSLFRPSRMEYSLINLSGTLTPTQSSYLPLLALGQLLDMMGRTASEHLPRALPMEVLQLGEPNLLLFPDIEVLPLVLRLYMAEEHLPLPSAQEVLICSNSTTAQQVSLLWRRSLDDPHHRRLFCLVKADRLSYEVSRSVCDELHRRQRMLRAEDRPMYKLVIVCTTENEDKSYVVSSLEPYRRCPPFVRSGALDDIRSYLKHKFRCKVKRPPKGSRDNRPFVPAAVVDHQYSSVRVVRSGRAGMGKSLFVERLVGQLIDKSKNPDCHFVVPVQTETIDVDTVLERLLTVSPSPNGKVARIIHLDVSACVANGLEDFLFSLVVLGQLTDSRGYVWLKQAHDLNIIEMTVSESVTEHGNPVPCSRWTRPRTPTSLMPFVECLPSTVCRSPRAEATAIAKGIPETEDREIGKGNFNSAEFQIVCQYLNSLPRRPVVATSTPKSDDDERKKSLDVILYNCALDDPSWAELCYFVNFLSVQLQDCENNDFCSPAAGLAGLKELALKLILRMSRDFATPSLSMIGHELARLTLRRHWEQTSHPYLFFNEDRHSMAFIGMMVTGDGQLVDPDTDAVLDTHIMSRDLVAQFQRQGFSFGDSCNRWSKQRKLEELSKVLLGVTEIIDPDNAYELTTDNMKKILAIHMRFRCGIPVVIMGETGCGKTRLIRYMCMIKARQTGARNLLLVKVHGGVTRNDLIQKVKQAEQLAKHNYSKHGVQTVLFFDEANTTNALGLIKEVMCDSRVNGQKVHGLGTRLQVVAACNPYRKHPEKMIARLEAAGLGYHVRSGDTRDRLGRIPLRQLVYRVYELPDSLKSLVWDFGQLNPDIEKLYIRQIVDRYIGKPGAIPFVVGLSKVISEILSAAQLFMKSRDDECSFVSLRDVERAMKVLVWFYRLMPLLENSINKKCKNSQERTFLFRHPRVLDPITRSLVLSLGVCYQARLQQREAFQHYIVRHFCTPCSLFGGAQQMKNEIAYCQEVFLDQMDLPPRTARNRALSENIFMMLVCIDLRIPLFVVGKPGSSKSLAKDIVKSSMMGHLSHTPLFRALKHLDMVSYQCSGLSTAEGIIATFRQCQRQEADRDREKFVSCVVLDEVGLAEDSPQLPLKSLHPLLDDGTAYSDDMEEETQRVAFVGISNWALDPAKMNRGILLNRDVPSNEELVVSALGICSLDQRVLQWIKPYANGLSEAYLEIYEKQSREFYGLRDFYSLVKMLFAFCKVHDHPPTRWQLEHVVRRNFGGQETIDSVEVFHRLCKMPPLTASVQAPVDNSIAGLITANLAKGQGNILGESRYLLLLTENNAALNIIQQSMLVQDGNSPLVVFGSSFSNDQEYTQICRTINKVKLCMATGRTVVLLNLDKIYESLYDTLNQYYVYHGGQRFVDLGLGTHRVKCQVHADFRLILVAERDVVFKQFPIPLINRMEKHFLAMSSVLSPAESLISKRVEEWAETFACVNPERYLVSTNKTQQKQFEVRDAFVGYHRDAAATVVIQVSKQLVERRASEEQLVFDLSRRSLLCCATPDAMARLPLSTLSSSESEELWHVYFHLQRHASIDEYLMHEMDLLLRDERQDLLIHITTHSRLLSGENIVDMAQTMGMGEKDVQLVALHQFDTEQQFTHRVRSFFAAVDGSDRILLIQSESGYSGTDTVTDLVACARYLVQYERDKGLNKLLESSTWKGGRRHVVFITQLPRISGGCFVGFHGGNWKNVHIDELRPSNMQLPPMDLLANRSISSLIDAEQTTETAAGSLRSGKDDDSLPQQSVVSPVIPTRRLDVCYLVRACVHSAVSRIDDRNDSVENAAQRMHLLFNLLPESEQATNQGCLKLFIELRTCLVKLLREKDARGDKQSAVHWMRNEALSITNIQAGGTFRRTLWLRLLSSVSPCLSELIAFMDADRNLRVLTDGIASVSSDWLTELWLDLFSYFHSTQIHYEHFLSPVQGQLRQRVPLESSGYKGHRFNARFPFSRLVRAEMENMMQKAKALAGESSDRPEHVLPSLFDASDLRRVLWKDELEVGKRNSDLVDRYLHDIIHTLHCPQSKDEYMLLQYFILSAVSELGCRHVDRDENAEGEKKPEVTLPLIHAAVAVIRGRLRFVCDVLRQRPDTTADVKHHIGIKAYSWVVTDAVVALSLVGKLSPSIDSFQTVFQMRKWMLKIEQTKPLLVSWLSLCVNVESLDDSTGWTQLRSATRRSWDTISALRSFTEHVQALGEDPFVLHATSLLWKCLSREDVDFTTEKTISDVQAMLNESNRQYADRLFGCNSDECGVCWEAWTDAVRLPCAHIFCCRCVSALHGNPSCPVCREEIPSCLEILPDEQLRVAALSYRSYKRCCTDFFIELVWTYSFAEAEQVIPEPGLVDKLLEVVTRQRMKGGKLQTKPFSPFDEDVFDMNPVVRSFFLRLLLKCSRRSTLVYIETYFHHARCLAQVSRSEDVEELRVVFVQCIEDSLHQRAARLSLQEQTDLAVIELQSAIQLSSDDGEAELAQVAYLQWVAGVRFGLTVTAQCLGEWMAEHDASTDTTKKQRREHPFTSTDHVMPAAINKLNVLSQELCRSTEDSHLSLFLVKQLVRKIGSHVLPQLQQQKELSWLVDSLPMGRNVGDEKIADYFVVLQGPYLVMRKAVARSLASCDITNLAQYLKKQKTKESVHVVTVSCLLAFYSELTLRRTVEDGQRVDSLIVSTFEKLCRRKVLPKWAREILGNTQGRPVSQLQVAPGQSAEQRAIAGLAVHARLVIMATESSPLVKPLHCIMNKPRTMMNAFLPTMPEDYYSTARDVVQGTRWYECRNGHPYLVANCGRPTVHQRCVDCGAVIGEGSHDSDARENQSREIGHILGAAERRSRNVAAERELTSTGVTAIRLLLHAALMWASCHGDKGSVSDLVSPTVPLHDLPSFFWHHFELDVHLLARSIGRSVESTVVVGHQLLNKLLTNNHNMPELTLGSKQERTIWEATFNHQILIPTFQTMQTEMDGWMQLVVQDERLGSNPVMRLVYEMDEPVNSRSSSSLWRYRDRVTLEHLARSLDQAVDSDHSSQHEVLREFLKQEPKLRALRYLPDVLRLHQLLLNRFHHRISLQEAKTFSIGAFLETLSDEIERQNISDLVEVYAAVWQSVKEPVFLQGRLRLKHQNQELSNITLDTPLAYLLPGTVGEGMCATALLDYLINCTHNDFIRTYRKLAGIESEAHWIPIEDVTPAHLVAYDAERDLMPLMLSHCDCSLTIGEGTKLTYNFATLEKQVVDRFICGKPFVEMKVNRIAFRKEVCNAALYATVKERIPQKELSDGLKKHILSELRDLTDVYGVLSLLDVVVGFVVSTGGSPEMLIHSYMHDALKMPAESSLVSLKAQQHCKLKHIIDLWRVLAVEKSKRLTLAQEEPFETVPEKYKEFIPAKEQTKLERSVRKLNIEQFLVELMEIITLELPQWDKTQKMEEYGLVSAMQELYLSELLGLDTINDKLQLRHIIHCWRITVKVQTEISGQR